MICPRCSVADISPATGECVLCGYSPSANVAVDRIVADEVRETIQEELAGRFELKLLVRSGRRSLVYLARSVGDDRLVAVKLLPLQGPVDPELARRFQQEATVAMSVDHPHLVPVYDYGLSRSLLWYSMEAVSKGRSLDAILADTGGLEVAQGLRIVEQVASALDYLHRRGVVHGSLKPSNILVDLDGWVKVVDAAIMYGISRAGQDPDWDLSPAPEYRAPEQHGPRAVGPAADQYALAVVTWEILTGSVPVRPTAELPEESGQRRTPPAPLVLRDVRPDVPARVSSAVQRAMAPTPTQRFPTVLDFVAVLGGGRTPAASGALTPVAAATFRPDRNVVLLPDPDPRRRPLVWGAGLLFALVLGLVLVLLVPRGDAPRSTADGMVDAPPATVPRPPVRAAVDSPARTQEVTVDAADGAAQPATSPTTGAAEVATPRPPAAPPPEPALLSVNATPWGLLYVDGELIGNTPQLNLRLAPGAHLIRVEREGFAPAERRIELAPGQILRITDITLAPRS